MNIVYLLNDPSLHYFLFYLGLFLSLWATIIYFETRREIKNAIKNATNFISDPLKSCEKFSSYRDAANNAVLNLRSYSEKELEEYSELLQAKIEVVEDEFYRRGTEERHARLSKINEEWMKYQSTENG